jgi:signal transduction histidine kinase
VKKDYGDVPEIFAYSNELNQVFMNLLLNAIQATPAGGTITIKTYKTYVANGNVFIQISDTGTGIPEEKLSKLFEPGFTTDKTRVKMTTGLYTTFNIVNKHRGAIDVESEVGKGSTFTIQIPENLSI